MYLNVYISEPGSAQDDRLALVWLKHWFCRLDVCLPTQSNIIYLCDRVAAKLQSVGRRPHELPLGLGAAG